MRDTMGSTANLILGLSEMDLPPKYVQTKSYGSKLLKPKKNGLLDITNCVGPLAVHF